MKYVILLALLVTGNAHAVNILVAGDSISLGEMTYLQALVPNVTHSGYCPYLKDKTTSANNTGNSRRLSACINLLLSRGSYDVVVFNAGMHDVHMALCDSGGTSHQVELSDYLINLQAVADAIRVYGAIPVFVTTTPVEVNNPACHFNSDIIAYNLLASQMMDSQGILVLDLYTAVFPNQGYLHGAQGIHFEPRGYDFIGHKVANFLNAMP